MPPNNTPDEVFASEISAPLALADNFETTTHPTDDYYEETVEIIYNAIAPQPRLRSRKRASKSKTMIDWASLEYLHPVDDNLLCAICKAVFYEPRTTVGCRHTFCRSCLKSALRTSRTSGLDASCPMCRDWLFISGNTNSYYTKADRIYDTLLENLEVKCPQELCDWTGRRGFLESHISTCDRVMVLCVNEWCPRFIMRGSQKEHCLHHEETCALCQQTIEAAQQFEHLSTKCPMATVNCTICQSPVERRDLAHHTNLCTNSKTPCKFQDVGCEYRGFNAANLQHEETCTYGRMFAALEERLLAKLDVKPALDSLDKQIRKVEDRVTAVELDIAEIRAKQPDLSAVGSPSDPERAQEMVLDMNRFMVESSREHNAVMQYEIRPMKDHLTDLHSQVAMLSRNVYWMRRSVTGFAGSSNIGSGTASTRINDEATSPTVPGRPPTHDGASNTRSRSTSAGTDDDAVTLPTPGRSLGGRTTPPRPSL